MDDGPLRDLLVPETSSAVPETPGRRPISDTLPSPARSTACRTTLVTSASVSGAGAIAWMPLPVDDGAGPRQTTLGRQDFRVEHGYVAIKTPLSAFVGW